MTVPDQCRSETIARECDCAMRRKKITDISVARALHPHQSLPDPSSPPLSTLTDPNSPQTPLPINPFG
eukprot:scaffold28166_cov112-Isochrysis_galbana.AAC.1